MFGSIQSAKALLSGLLVVGVVLAFFFLNHARKTAIARADDLQVQLKLAQANEAALRGEIADQNAKVAGLQAAANAVVAKGAAAVAVAKQQSAADAATTRARARTIITAVIDPGCQQAIDWAISQGSQLAQ